MTNKTFNLESAVATFVGFGKTYCVIMEIDAALLTETHDGSGSTQLLKRFEKENYAQNQLCAIRYATELLEKDLTENMQIS